MPSHRGSGDEIHYETYGRSRDRAFFDKTRRYLARCFAVGGHLALRSLGTRSEPHEKVESDVDRSIHSRERSLVWDFKTRGEPFLWGLGGALVIGIFMIVGFVVLIVYNGILTFYPRPIEVVTLAGRKASGR